MRGPWLRHAVVFALAILAVSCKGDARGQADPSGAAGDVREVTGNVTATRDGKAHALAVDDVVYAGDRIDTGDDGDVVIELRHNHVRWHLGPGQAKTPMEAVAWSAPPPTAAAVSDDRVSVAGRHAERSAAGTMASAVVNEDPGSRDGESRKGEVDSKKDEKHDKKKKPIKVTTSGGTGSGSGSASGTGRPPTGGGGGTCPDEVGCLLSDRPPACCAKYGAKKKSADDPKGGNLPDTLSRDDITAGIEPVKAKFAACGDEYPDGPGRVRLKIKVSASGSVTSVSLIDEVDAELEACLVSAAKRAKFAATVKGGAFTFPAILR